MDQTKDNNKLVDFSPQAYNKVTPISFTSLYTNICKYNDIGYPIIIIRSFNANQLCYFKLLN